MFIEFARVEFPWEKSSFKGLKYFVNKRVNNFPCLQKTIEDKNIDRFYFFLEYEDYKREVKKFLPVLYKNFLKYKEPDLRVKDCISTEGFIKMCKDFTIVPVFQSGKEILNVLS